ncbi:hypothetical protein AHiyo1_15180 [Arthrobacter sp. Hiyo1]|uniref:hypothetical protein n=1 Tax=Arthrobacter sp. Hiyo1 TaxID=1588020 RepID=UPI00072327D8|nr:hypothetical protein [Arthrobacter sp. Hiyo1]GAP58453.1 hypothetical protein AHiyo1_15180 [Arthrobacter sp. Hiyo1]
MQWTTAGIIAPIAGLGGTDTAVPMAAIMIVGALLSLVGLLIVARPSTPAGRSPAPRDSKQAEIG